MLRIDASTAHRINRDLTLASQYFDKIFTRLNGPPRWLARNIDSAFEWIDTPTFTYRRYNPYWNEQEVTPIVTKRSKCTHRQIFFTRLRYPHPPQDETFVTIPILIASNLSRIPQRRPPPLALRRPLIGANPFLFSVVHPVLHIPTNPAPPIFLHPPTNPASSLSGPTSTNPRFLSP